MPRNSLTARQQRFVEEYLCDLNATQAAIRAGYSAKNADKIGSQLLDKTRVVQAIERAKETQAGRIEIKADWVLQRLIANIERSMQEVPVRDRKGNKTGTYQYQGAVANKALELLGKHIGLFPDRYQHEITGDITVKVIEDESWYHPNHHDSESVTASGAGTAQPGAAQGAGRRQAVRQNRNGTAGLR